MGIFKIENLIQSGVDYAAALSNIESKIKENDAKRKKAEEDGQIDSGVSNKSKDNHQ